MEKYMGILLKYFERHNIERTCEELHREIHNELNCAKQLRYELLDDAIMEGMRYAEKNFRKLRKGAISWTPTFSDIHWILR